MKYSMTSKGSTIILDTESGNITGSTYAMKEIIKSDLYATWNAELKIWHSDKLAETVSEYNSYLTRCYGLRAEGPAEATGEIKKEIASTEMVNGKDGFYQIIRYTDGSSKKSFIG